MILLRASLVRPALLLAAVLVTGGPSLASAQDPSSSADRLTFAWPAGAEAQVTYSVEGWRQNGSTKTSVRRLTTYDLEVHARDFDGEPGFAIFRRWPTAVSKSSLFGKFQLESSSALQTLIDDLPELVPVLHVSQAGDLLAIDGGQAVRDRLDLVLEANPPAPMDRYRAIALAADESLFLTSHQAWSVLVSLWNGRHLEEDFPFGDRSGADVPSEPMRVEVPGSGQLRGHVPCSAEEDEPRCVELWWSASPQGKDAEEALEALESRQVDDLELTREITVIVDPSTLLPYSSVDQLVARRTIRRGDETLEAAEEMTRSRTFVWTLP